MGLEARCDISFRPHAGAEVAGDGAVHLDDAELLARGAARHRVPRASITGVAVERERLVVTHAAGTTTLTLGAPAAARWAARLAAAPKSVIDKLDVRAGMRACALDVPDAALLAEVAARTGHPVGDALDGACDVLLVGVLEPAHLPRIGEAAARLGEKACLWVLHPRGIPEVADTRIFAAAEQCGLVATKVVRVSERLSGEKLVRRKGR